MKNKYEVNPLFSPEEDSQILIQNWLEQKGAKFLQKIQGDEAHSSDWLQMIGVLPAGEQHLASRVVTTHFLKDSTDYGEGWLRGGSESFYKIFEIESFQRDTAEKISRHLAFKAVHSMGSITERLMTEATRIAYLSAKQVCGRMFAAGNGIIVKEFLLEDVDSEKLSSEIYNEQFEDIIEILKSVGLQPLVSRQLELIQHKKRLFLIDLGSGDISGPSAFEFVTHLSKK